MREDLAQASFYFCLLFNIYFLLLLWRRKQKKNEQMPQKLREAMERPVNYEEVCERLRKQLCKLDNGYQVDVTISISREGSEDGKV